MEDTQTVNEDARLYAIGDIHGRFSDFLAVSNRRHQARRGKVWRQLPDRDTR